MWCVRLERSTEAGRRPGSFYKGTILHGEKKKKGTGQHGKAWRHDSHCNFCTIEDYE